MFFQSEQFKVAGIACAVPDDLELAEAWNGRFGKEAVKKFVKSTGVEQHYIETRLNIVNLLEIRKGTSDSALRHEQLLCKCRMPA